MLHVSVKIVPKNRQSLMSAFSLNIDASIVIVCISSPTGAMTACYQHFLGDLEGYPLAV